MRGQLAIALRLTAFTLVLTGFAYPFAVTAVARFAFPRQTAGSFVTGAGGQIVGSALIGQGFSGAAYFHPRPSAAGKGYDAAASSPSNLGPSSAALRKQVGERVAALTAENPDARGPVPADLATASGSGLDPHVSLEAALWQVPRVARIRGVDEARVRALVTATVEGRSLGLFGEPRVNVLLLNLALDRELGAP